MKKATKARERKVYPREFVVGYKGDSQCVYGSDARDKNGTMVSSYTDRMTIHAALKKVKALTSPGVVRVIYRLVPFAVVPILRTAAGGKRR